MKKYKIYLFLFSLIFTSTFISCNKENIYDKAQGSSITTSLRSSEGVSFNGKWLVFQNMQDFQNKLDELILAEYNENDSEFTSFEGDFNGYISIRSSNSTMLDDDMTIDDIISQNYLYTPSTAFGTLVSENGLIQVGDSIFYYTTGDSSYIIPSEHSNYLLVNDTYNIANLSGVEGFVSGFGLGSRRDLDDSGAIIVSGGNSGSATGSNKNKLCDFTDNPNKAPNSLKLGSWVRSIYKDENDNPFPQYKGREVRFQIEIHRHFYLLYNYVGVKSRIQNKNKKGKWKNKVKANNLSIKACGHGEWTNFACSSFPWQNSIAKSKNNTKKLSKNLDAYIPILSLCFYSPQLYNINANYKGTYEGASFEYTVKF